MSEETRRKAREQADDFMRLAEAAESVEDGELPDNEQKEHAKNIRKAAEMMHALSLLELPEWIRVEERLPDGDELNEYVLVHCDDGIIFLCTGDKVALYGPLVCWARIYLRAQKDSTKANND